MISFCKVGVAAVAAIAMAASAAGAEPFKLKIACTATSDCASAMVARDEGIFAKHGIDAEVTLIGINTNIPPAIASDSIRSAAQPRPSFCRRWMAASTSSPSTAHRS